MDAFDFRPLCDLTAQVILFPVRHHSPTAARLVQDLIRRVRPAAVLIECPFDFNARLDELYLPHLPPLAIYSYVRRSDGVRSGAFYPMCEYSPEWQAIQAGRQAGAEVRFIDLPWADVAGVEEPSNRFSDAAFRRSQYIAMLCRKVGVDDFDTLWDTLFEIDPALDAETYLFRCHHLCGSMRLLEGPGRLSDRRREAFMVQQIRDRVGRRPGQVLVVVGGAHCLPLYLRMAGQPGELTDPEAFQPAASLAGEERGIALTPYSFERLDNLTGYEAGMPNPRFYQQVWQDRQAGRMDTHRTLLGQIVQRLRDARQPISAADLIAAETTATALAGLRAHAEVWRTDLVDGLIGSLVKEELNQAGRHPLLTAIHEMLRGGQRGSLAAGALLPPLVHDIQAQLRLHDLVPDNVPREVELVLENAADRPGSQVLHQLRLLQVAGFERTAGTDLANQTEVAPIWERWRIVWSPEFDAWCIEAARYGASLAEAAAAMLGECAGAVERDAAAAALLLLDAALAGLTELALTLRQRVAERLRSESDFFLLTQGLGHLLYLYRYDSVLQTAGAESLGELLHQAYDRALWLLETLGQTAGRGQDLVNGLMALREAFERCELALGLSRTELIEVLLRVANDPGQQPIVRGAALGAQWSLGATDGETVREQMKPFTDPERMGDFLTGLFALVREQVQRQRDLVVRIHEVLSGYSDEQFLNALPALRLAFTAFTPREKHHLALTLRQSLGLDKARETSALTVDATTAAQALAFEGRLFAAAAKYGLKRVHPMNDREALTRWRLVLGSEAEQGLGCGLDGVDAGRDCALGYLYHREVRPGRNVRGEASKKRSAGLDDSELTVPEWINEVHELFPKQTIERIERDALERYHLLELVTNPELLARAQPSQSLLKAVLQTKHLMNQEVLNLARQLVRKVIEQLLEKLARPVQQVFQGARDRRNRSHQRVAKNFDARTTVRRNLAYFALDEQKLYLRTPFFFSRVRRQADRWQVIVVVDESGSMADSVIHAAVTAAIFVGVGSLKTHLVLFDTNVVDVTEHAGDPVEAIMKVQLGGGTDIGNALSYAAGLVENPRRTIVVLITDFFEGGPPDRLLGVTKSLIESGATVLGLAALDDRADPTYDRDMAAQMAAMGAHIGAMTPGELAEWVAKRVR